MNFRFISVICLLIIFINGNSQSIKFELYIKSNCNDSVYKMDFFGLQKDSIILFTSPNQAYIEVKDTGYYKLVSAEIEDSAIIHINKIGLVKDTIKKVDIFYGFTIHKKPSYKGWFCCDKKCDGFQIDYYDNGNKRIEGLFKDGKVVGDLLYYNKNGTLRKIEKYDRKGEKIN